MVLGQLDAENKGWLLSHTTDKNYSKWIQDLHLRAKTIKLLEDNIGENVHDIGFGNISWTWHQKDSKRNKNINWTLSKEKTFVYQRTPSGKWRNNLKNDIKHFQIPYLTSDFYLEYLKNSYNSTTNNPIQKWPKDLNRHLSKEVLQMVLNIISH